MVVLDEDARRLKQKHRDEIKEFELNKAREIERIKEDNSMNEKNLRERISKMEKIRHSLEDVLFSSLYN
jgi:dephospho-CoA kinase